MIASNPRIRVRHGAFIGVFTAIVIYNTDRYEEYVDVNDNEGGGIWAFVAMTIIGIVVGLGGLIINLRGSVAIFGEHGPFMTVAAMLFGSLLVAVGLLYLAKALFSRI